jgi:Sugar-tranasporters, 12 TM
MLESGLTLRIGWQAVVQASCQCLQDASLHGPLHAPATCAAAKLRQSCAAVADCSTQHSVFTALAATPIMSHAAGDWLQGPYVYALYQHYGYQVGDIGRLFIAGFGSSMIFGTIAGTMADQQCASTPCDWTSTCTLPAIATCTRCRHMLAGEGARHVVTSSAVLRSSRGAKGTVAAAQARALALPHHA